MNENPINIYFQPEPALKDSELWTEFASENSKFCKYFWNWYIPDLNFRQLWKVATYPPGEIA